MGASALFPASLATRAPAQPRQHSCLEVEESSPEKPTSGLDPGNAGFSERGRQSTAHAGAVLVAVPTTWVGLRAEALQLLGPLFLAPFPILFEILPDSVSGGHRQ